MPLRPAMERGQRRLFGLLAAQGVGPGQKQKQMQMQIHSLLQLLR